MDVLIELRVFVACASERARDPTLLLFGREFRIPFRATFQSLPVIFTERR